MIPQDLNLELYRGDTKRWQFTVFTDQANTIPADLSGVEATATIRDKATGGALELDLPCTITPPNIIDMVLSADDARTLPAKGVWDLQLTYPSGDVMSIIKGTVATTQDVTYPAAPPVVLRAVS